jgi:hypothetical protein
MSYKIERFEPRFIPVRLLGELSALWHTSRVPCGSDHHARLCQTARWFHNAHPDISETAAYKDLDNMLSFGRRCYLTEVD